MLLWLVLSTSADAQSALLLEPQLPVTTEIGVQMGTVAGVDLWRDPAGIALGSGGISGIDLTSGVEHAIQNTTFSATQFSQINLWTTTQVYDGHAAQLSVRNSNGPGGALDITGSASQGWWAGTLGGLYSQSVFTAQIGGHIRQSEEVRPFGLDAQILAGDMVTEILYLGLSGRTVLLAGDQVSSFAGLTGLWSLGLGSRTSLMGAVGFQETWGNTEAQATGILPSDATFVHGSGQAQYALTPVLALQAEMALERASGPVDWTRFTATTGLHIRGSVRQVRDAGVTAGWVRLTYRDDDAGEVMVSGTFTDWQPLPLSHNGTQWYLDLEIPPGNHEYVYLVDKEPVVPPESSYSIDDGYGGRNGVLTVSVPPL